MPAVPADAGTTGVTTSISSAPARARSSFSFRPWTSADGRFVAFDSDAGHLVTPDTNGARDIFVYDRARGTVARVSVGIDGEEANGDSQRPTLSDDGRYVAFWSEATNLVSGDTNDVADAFVYDRLEGTTDRVSVGPGGAQGNGTSARPVISGDGRYVAFESASRSFTPPDLLGRYTDTNRVRDIFVHDRLSGETTRVSNNSDGTQATAESVRPTISADGRYVAFHSEAALDPADTNSARDVYVFDQETGTLSRASVSAEGVEGDGGSFSPSLSADGRYVAFWSNASNLVAGDTNGESDVFVFDREAGTVTRASVASDGTEGDAQSSDPSISPDGRYVAFWSLASTLVDGDGNGVRDVFLHDVVEGTTLRASVGPDGAEGNADSYSPSVSEGGGMVAFDSEASTLVDDDSNRGSDIFIYTS